LRRVVCEPVVVRGGRGGRWKRDGVGRDWGAAVAGGAGAGGAIAGAGGAGGEKEREREEEDELEVEEGKVIVVCWEGRVKTGMTSSW